MKNEINAIKEIIQLVKNANLGILEGGAVSISCYNNNVSDINGFKKYTLLPLVKYGYISRIKGNSNIKIEAKFNLFDWGNVDWELYCYTVDYMEQLGTDYKINKAISDGKIDLDSIFKVGSLTDGERKYLDDIAEGKLHYDEEVAGSPQLMSKEELTESFSITKDRFFEIIKNNPSLLPKDRDLEEGIEKLFPEKPQPSNEDTELVEMVCDWMDLEKIHKYDSMTGELIPKIDRFKQLFKKYNEEE